MPPETESNKNNNCSNNINIGGSNPVTVIAAAAVLTAEKAVEDIIKSSIL